MLLRAPLWIKVVVDPHRATHLVDVRLHVVLQPPLARHLRAPHDARPRRGESAHALMLTAIGGQSGGAAALRAIGQAQRTHLELLTARLPRSAPPKQRCCRPPR